MTAVTYQPGLRGRCALHGVPLAQHCQACCDQLGLDVLCDTCTTTPTAPTTTRSAR